MTSTDDEKIKFMGLIVDAVARWQHQEGNIPDTAQGRAVIDAAVQFAQRLLVMDGSIPEDLPSVAIRWERDYTGQSEPAFYFDLPRRTDEEMRRMEKFCADEIAKLEGMKAATADRCPHCGQLMGDRR